MTVLTRALAIQSGQVVGLLLLIAPQHVAAVSAR
jgi:hypothetical protein